MAELPSPSVAVTVTVNVPDALGVPVIWTVWDGPGVYVSPAGSPATLHVYGHWPPPATTVARYEDDFTPEGSDVVRISTGPVATVRASCTDSSTYPDIGIG